MNHWEALPDELVYHVVSYLEPSVVVTRLALTSSSFRTILSKEDYNAYGYQGLHPKSWMQTFLVFRYLSRVPNAHWSAKLRLDPDMFTETVHGPSGIHFWCRPAFAPPNKVEEIPRHRAILPWLGINASGDIYALRVTHALMEDVDQSDGFHVLPVSDIICNEKLIASYFKEILSAIVEVGLIDENGFPSSLSLSKLGISRAGQPLYLWWPKSKPKPRIRARTGIMPAFHMLRNTDGTPKGPIVPNFPGRVSHLGRSSSEGNLFSLDRGVASHVLQTLADLLHFDSTIDLSASNIKHSYLSRCSPVFINFLICAKRDPVSKLLAHPFFELASHEALVEFAEKIAGKKLFGPYGGNHSLQDADFVDSNLAPRSPNTDGTISGFKYYEGFITLEEEKSLLTYFDGHDWDIDKDGRRVQIYGYNYLRHLAPQKSIPTELQALLDKIKSACNGVRFDQLIVTEYVRGQGFHPHLDRLFWGPVIAGLSLSSDCIMELSTPDGIIATRQPIHPRSLYILSEGARYDYLHAIDGHSVEARRVSLTFRTMATEKVAPPPFPLDSMV